MVNSLSYFALIAAILLTLLQGCVLLVIMIYAFNEFAILACLVLDIPLFIYFVYTAFVSMSSATTAVQWFIYCLGLAGKVGILFFWPNQEPLRKFGIGAELVLFITPTINVLLIAQARSVPGGMFVSAEEQLSVAGLLHYDTMTLVTLDLLDLTVAYAVSRRSQFVFIHAAWAYYFLGFVIVNGLALLCLTFPSTAMKYTNAKIIKESDIFITAKLTNVAMLFFIDVPLLFYRCYCMFLNPTAGFQLFAFKNIICIIFRPYRLHQSRLAESNTAKGFQKTFFYAKRKPFLGDPQPHLNPGVTKLVQDTSFVDGGLVPITNESYIGMKRDTIGSSVVRFKQKCAGYDKATIRLVDELRDKRLIPVKGFSLFTIFSKILGSIFIQRRKKYDTVLDHEVTAPYFTQVGLCIPMLTAWISQLVLMVVLWGKQSPDSPPSACWTEFTKVDKIWLGVCCANFGVFMGSFLLIAPTLEVFAVTFLWILRLVSFYCSTRALVSTGIPFWLWLIEPVVGLISTSPAIFSALLGRQYMYVFFKNLDNDKERVSTTAVLLLFLCRNHFAPISLHKLLVGPDIIKSVKLMDAMRNAHWRDIILLSILKFWNSLAAFCLWTGCVYLAHMCSLIISTLASQAISLICVRKFEVRLLLSNLICSHSVNGNLDNSKASAGLHVDKSYWREMDKSYLTFLDIEHKHISSGFFSSPGTVFPSIIGV